MIKKFKPKLITATMDDYPVIQNMARFYAYDMSRYCGFISNEWNFPKDGLYEAHDFRKYFEEPGRKAFLIKIDDELAGFVLLNRIGTLPDTEWDMGEFYVLGKFQGKGIAKQVAYQIWQEFHGKWEVTVIPENLVGLAFWRKTISNFTKGHYKEEIKKVEYDKHQPNRYIFSFDTKELASEVDTSVHAQKYDLIEIEEIDQKQAETLCRKIINDLPEYFGIPSANEQYFKGVHSCKNFAAKIENHYVGLLSLNFPYENNSNIYWMGIMRDYQAKGIGRRLMEEACQLARKLNATTMTVETLSPAESDDNYLKTYQFYQSMGFKPLVNLKPEGYEWEMVYMAKYLSHAMDKAKIMADKQIIGK